MSRYGVSESTSSGGSVARAGVELERREHDLCRRARRADRLLEDREHRHAAAAARRLALRDHDLRLARLEPLGDGRRGEAGEDRHLDRADVRARVRGDGDLGRHRQEDRDAVARADAERDERLGEPRHVARELGERERAARAVLAEPDGGERVRAALGPAVHAVARDRDFAADEPRRPLRPARVVEHLVPRLRELEPQVVDAERPEPVRVVLRAADELRVVRGARPAHEPRRVRVLDRRLVGRPHHVASRGQPYLRACVSVC